MLHSPPPTHSAHCGIGCFYTLPPAPPCSNFFGHSGSRNRYMCSFRILFTFPQSNSLCQATQLPVWPTAPTPLLPPPMPSVSSSFFFSSLVVFFEMPPLRAFQFQHFKNSLFCMPRAVLSLLCSSSNEMQTDPPTNPGIFPIGLPLRVFGCGVRGRSFPANYHFHQFDRFVFFLPVCPLSVTCYSCCADPERRFAGTVLCTMTSFFISAIALVSILTCACFPSVTSSSFLFRHPRTAPYTFIIERQ